MSTSNCLEKRSALPSSSLLSQPLTLVIIDSGVDAVEQLAADITAQTAIVHRLSSDRSGIDQITEILESTPEVIAVHLISHGTPATLHLGNEQLSLQDSLTRGDDLQQWTTKLQGKDLLLYGCEVGQGARGHLFLQQLHQLTGANISASARPVGRQNWDLEVAVGQPSSSIIFSELLQTSYTGQFLSTINLDIGTASITAEGKPTFSVNFSISDPPPGGGSIVELSGHGQSTSISFPVTSSEPSTSEPVDHDPVTSDPVASDPVTSDSMPNFIPSDFNSDGSPELLFTNRNTGEIAYWSTSELGNAASTIADTLSAESVRDVDVIGTADFNGDGQSDILVRDAALDINKALIFDGTQQVASVTIGANLPVSNPDWRMRSVGNFDGDGELEILWRNKATGGLAIWNVDINNNATSTFLDVSNINLGDSTLPNPDWEIQAAADVDGDGRCEIFWRNTSTGGNAIWRLNDAGVVESSTFITDLSAPNWNMIDANDYNQDGVVDIAWRNEVTGQNAIWTMGQTSEGFARVDSTFIPSLTPEVWATVNE